MAGKSRKVYKRRSHKRSSNKHKRSSNKRSSHKRSRHTHTKKCGHKHKRSRHMYGGNAPLMGSPYNAADLHPQGNYHAYNTKVEAWPQQSNAIAGGRGRKGKRRLHGGGFSTFVTALLPEEVVNIGRSVPAAAGHMYDKFNGSLSPASTHVYPTQQPLIPQALSEQLMKPPDIMKMYTSNNNLVSKL